MDFRYRLVDYNKVGCLEYSSIETWRYQKLWFTALNLFKKFCRSAKLQVDRVPLFFYDGS